MSITSYKLLLVARCAKNRCQSPDPRPIWNCESQQVVAMGNPVKMNVLMRKSSIGGGYSIAMWSAEGAQHSAADILRFQHPPADGIHKLGYAPKASGSRKWRDPLKATESFHFPMASSRNVLKTTKSLEFWELKTADLRWIRVFKIFKIAMSKTCGSPRIKPHLLTRPVGTQIPSKSQTLHSLQAAVGDTSWDKSFLIF